MTAPYLAKSRDRESYTSSEESKRAKHLRHEKIKPDCDKDVAIRMIASVVAVTAFHRMESGQLIALCNAPEHKLQGSQVRASHPGVREDDNRDEVAYQVLKDLVSGGVLEEVVIEDGLEYCLSSRAIRVIDNYTWSYRSRRSNNQRFNSWTKASAKAVYRVLVGK